VSDGNLGISNAHEWSGIGKLPKWKYKKII